VVIGGITFTSLGERGDSSLLASCEMQTVDYLTATNEFNRLLLLALDAIAVVMGAGASPRGASTLVEKRRSKYVLLQAIKRRPSGSLTVFPGHHDRSISEADQLARDFPKLQRGAANYLRQTVGTESLIDTAFHLLQATEALASKSPTRTDYVKVKMLMGKDVYSYFYERDPALASSRRNALAHGRMIEESGDLAKAVDSLHETLLLRLRADLSITAQPTFTSVRGFTSFDQISAFLERPEADLPALPDLVGLAFDGLSNFSSPRLVRPEVARRLSKTY
jgi:hypothetical protein